MDIGEIFGRQRGGYTGDTLDAIVKKENISVNEKDDLRKKVKLCLALIKAQ